MYKAEYAISRDALTIINEQFSFQLPDDEIGFIALHILNNYENSSDYESVRIIELSQKITEIIEVFITERWTEVHLTIQDL